MDNLKLYDLEKRTAEFAKEVRNFLRQIKLDITNIEDAKQVARSSGSIAANYIEANEALSKKDFVMRIKICRKEAKETRLWLNIIKAGEFEKERIKLCDEADQLMKIFGAIIQKSV